MILYVVRHAWADHPHWADDHARPLTDEGRARFAQVVERLTAVGFAPQLVLTSPLVRCRQTADVIAEVVPLEVSVAVRDELEPGSNLRGLLKWVRQHAADCPEMAWVGHAPDVSVITAALIGEGDAAIAFSKGAVAAIEFDDRPEIGGGALKWLATAKLLGC